MKDTVVALSKDQQERCATPHIDLEHPVEAWDFADMPGVGGIRSSTADMLRFAEAHLNPPGQRTGASDRAGLEETSERTRWRVFDGNRLAYRARPINPLAQWANARFALHVDDQPTLELCGGGLVQHGGCPIWIGWQEI